MQHPGTSIASLRNEAERRFLGRAHVTGIGIANHRRGKLVFLLDENCPSLAKEIRDWANAVHIDLEFHIVGKFQPAI